MSVKSAAFTIGFGAIGLGLIGPAQAQAPVGAASQAQGPQAQPAGVPAAAPQDGGQPGAQPARPPIALEPAPASELRDPWEGWNRGVYNLNDRFDRWFAEPVAKTYKRLTPRPIRSGVRNVLANLDSPLIFVNDVLQVAPARAGTTAARFGLNSTIGIGGIFDPATAMGLARHDEDFGQTLGHYGVSPGPYLVLPLLGPSSVRDFAGWVVDFGLDPLTYISFRDDDIFRVSKFGMELVTARADAIETIDNLRRTSPDPYVTMRTFYGEARAAAVNNGQQNVQDLPDFSDPMPESGPPTENQKP